MSKPTIATVKSFIKKNSGKLHILVNSRFDGMIDGCASTGETRFSQALPTEFHLENTLGIQGAWFVRSSRDYIKPFDDGKFWGYDVWNCCGSFIIAIPK